MRARDIIVIARRRAGITQQELGGRLGTSQVTVARWESGATEPKFQTVQEVVAACGLDLTLGLANADEGSWNSLIYDQLQRTPADRVKQLSRGGFDRVAALKLLGCANVRAIVVGETAGALHGWPLILNASGQLDLLVHNEDRQQAEVLVASASDPKRFCVVDTLPGAWGYADLARNSVHMEVDGAQVQVAALVDLLRVALSENGRFSLRFALAYDETLRLTERLRASSGDAEPRKRTEQEARDEAERWLARQAVA
jgi:transcriptional regulator with XRE-family HTH domain